MASCASSQGLPPSSDPQKRVHPTCARAEDATTGQRRGCRDVQRRDQVDWESLEEAWSPRAPATR
eukprot:4499836-Alexandrium_andersonii.AAC.1